MATRRYGISRGKINNGGNVVTEAVGSATAADNIELTIDLAPGMARSEVVMAITRIQEHIMRGIWPPA
jgi:hypothetical protein